MRVLILVPVLNDGRSLSALIAAAGKVVDDASRYSWLVVDDGSVPPLAASELPGEFRGHILTLSRNLGHQRAIAIGLSYAVENELAETIVIMDADGEDRPTDIPALVAAVQAADQYAVAVARRRKRTESLVFQTFYRLYRLFFALLTGRRIPFGNFCAMRMEAARRLVAMSELWLTLPGAILRSRLPIIELPMDRGSRYSGRSQMNIVSLLILGSGAFVAFLDSVLTRVFLAGLCLLAVSLIASAVAVGLKIAGMATPGWMTSVLGTSLLLVVGTVGLSFLALTLTILTGAHTTPTPLSRYRAFISSIVSSKAT